MKAAVFFSCSYLFSAACKGVVDMLRLGKVGKQLIPILS